MLITNKGESDKMKTISFINLKGGVGKTTIATNTAYILSQVYETRVLLIDNDKQGNASQFFGADTDENKQLADILTGEKNSPDSVISKTKYKGLDIIPSDMSLAAANMALLQDGEKEQFAMLAKFTDKIKNDYDFCIIDNAPDINISVLNALVITNEVIVVSTPDEYSLQGMKEMQEQIDLAREFNNTILFRGCLMNKFTKTLNSFTMKARIKKNYPVFNTNIRLTQDRLNVSTVNKTPILEQSPRCGFSQDIKKFVRELLYIN